MAMFNNNLGGPNDLFLDFLEERPEMAFQGALPRGGSPGQQRFFQRSFEPIHNMFLGNLARQITGGQMPQGRFSDFLGGFDFPSFAAAQSPFQRGEQQQRFSPSTRFLFNF